MAGYGARVRRTVNVDQPIILHILGIANPKTNALYVIIFEAPEKEWPAAWKIGEPILKKFMLDDED